MKDEIKESTKFKAVFVCPYCNQEDVVQFTIEGVKLSFSGVATCDNCVKEYAYTVYFSLKKKASAVSWEYDHPKYEKEFYPAKHPQYQNNGGGKQ